MAWNLRFRKAIRSGPLHFNVTERGLTSVSVGGLSARETLGLDGHERTTLSLSGSRLSLWRYQQHLSIGRLVLLLLVGLAHAGEEKSACTHDNGEWLVTMAKINGADVLIFASMP